ncbi:MAG: FHA domain-containing protein [Bacteroidales bacterium]|nr:FHA domain-containing protein [Bacteroidales bacterium]
MENLKKCKNGHYYDKNLDHCPYCPQNQDSKMSANNNLDKTEVAYNTKTGNNNSTIADSDTKKSSSLLETEFAAEFNSEQNEESEVDLSKTYIQGVEIDEEDGNTSKSEFRLSRKIVGWIISYTIDEMGADYQIFEGRNTIGTNSQNNISLSHDVTISSQHLTILFRNGIFHAKDELSSNGTLINDKEVKPNEIIELHDGDKIKIGETIFIFKTPLD